MAVVYDTSEGGRLLEHAGPAWQCQPLRPFAVIAMQPVRALLSLVLMCAVPAGCTLLAATALLPTAQRHWQLPAGTTTAQLFDCGEQTLDALRDSNSSWETVSRCDEPNGVLETGHYPQRNRTGFRLRLHHERSANTAKLALRGAGAWFADLGVEAAAGQLQAGIASCLRSPGFSA